MIAWRWSQFFCRPSVRAPFRSHNLSHYSSSTPIQPSIADILRISRTSEAPSPKTSVHGFVRSVRKHQRVAFVAIGDGSTIEPLQVVLTPTQAESLSTGAAVTIYGEWKPTQMGKEQSHELHAEKVELLGDNDVANSPMQKKYQTPEFLRTVPHLRSRTPHNGLLLRLRSHIIADITKFLNDRGFIQTHTPIITSSDCEGAGEVFTVSARSPAKENLTARQTEPSSADAFFRTPKYLTVSSQLHLEALAQSVGNVWTLSPTFRAEKSDTARHLSEFYMLEAEIAFIDELEHVMNLVEDLIGMLAINLKTSNIGRELLSTRTFPDRDTESGSPARRESLVNLPKRWETLIRGPWPRITYHEAIASIQKAVHDNHTIFDTVPNLETGLQAEHERFLAKVVGNSGPIFVTDYPEEQKPFYMAPSKGSSKDGGKLGTVACFDLLLPDIGEVVGGSMREHRLHHLEAAIGRKGLFMNMNRSSSTQQDEHKKAHYETKANADQSSLDWYLDLRRYGSVGHGGFGLGFDRLLCFLSGVSNIRDVVSFPRWYGRCVC